MNNLSKKILVCVGTRPNLIKITQLEKVIQKYNYFDYILLHTGQHYDNKMNDIFFEELGIKKPDFQFTLKGGSQIQVIAEIMQKFENVCNEIKPDLVIVPGDVNSSFACAFVANRIGIPVAHIESGLRSFDYSMPEEINRILIDQISSLHFITEPSGIQNLKNEGFSEKTIKYVGNSMIDSLVGYNQLIDKSPVLSEQNLKKNEYVIFTFHRPVNVDNATNLSKLINLMKKVSEMKKVVFPIHPRTLKNIVAFGLDGAFKSIENIVKLDPQGYIDFLNLIKNSSFVLTDSGGVQEETTFLQIPCLTVRPNTERPITIEKGTNKLMPFEEEEIISEINIILNGNFKKGEIPNLWDGQTSSRILKEIDAFFKGQR
jgi:UDP-N-acetylglucosamine 2-epimerase (non-hydrolysing)